jgi:hypothetical protein
VPTVTTSGVVHWQSLHAAISCMLQSAADLAEQGGKDKEALKAEARDVR